MDFRCTIDAAWDDTWRMSRSEHSHERRSLEYDVELVELGEKVCGCQEVCGEVDTEGGEGCREVCGEVDTEGNTEENTEGNTEGGEGSGEDVNTEVNTEVSTEIDGEFRSCSLTEETSSSNTTSSSKEAGKLRGFAHIAKKAHKSATGEHTYCEEEYCTITKKRKRSKGSGTHEQKWPAGTRRWQAVAVTPVGGTCIAKNHLHPRKLY
jgi:hypothetical protein